MRMNPASTAPVMGFILSSAAAPSVSIDRPRIAPCASCPTRLPSFSANAIYGFRRGASSAARAIHDAHAALGLAQRLARQDSASLVGERSMQGDEVGASEQLVQFDLLDTELQRSFGR